MSKILRKFSSVLLSLLMILNALAPISIASAENSSGKILEHTISEPTETSNKTTATSLDKSVSSGNDNVDSNPIDKKKENGTNEKSDSNFEDATINKKDVTSGTDDNSATNISNPVKIKLEKQTRPTPLEPPKKDIKVEKIWQDKDGKEITAPEEKIEVELYRDGQSTGKKLELNKANKWRGEFKDLDTLEKTDSEKAYEYTVKEVGEDKGETTIGKNKYQVSYDRNTKDGFKVINKEEKSTSIKVKKVWKDQTDKVTDPMEEKVTVELYKDGKATGKKVTLNDANNWTATFEQIENTSESKYTVKEIGEKDGRIEIRRDFYSVIYEGNSKDGFTVENKYINEERAYVPIGKHIILPKGTADQKRENLLYLVNGPDDEWNFTYKIEKLKDKDTVEREYDPITITIPNIIKENKNTFFQDISQKIGRNISSIDQLSNDEIDTAYYIAREKLLRVRGAEDHEIKIEQNVHGEGEAIFRVTENPSNYVNISDDKNNERYHYYKVYKDENGEFDIYWNFANSYDKLDRNNKNYFEDDGEYEELFKEAVGETWFEYIGQSNNYSSRDNIRFNLLSSYYNKIKSPTQIDPSKTDIKVEKAWEDKDGKEIAAPVEKIEVELYRDGEATGKKLELNKANKWSGELKDLDVVEKLDSEKAYEYTVKEVGEKDGSITIGDSKYKVSYNGSMEEGFKVTNKLEEKSSPWTPLTPSKADIKVEKIWQDKDGKEITAPEEKIEVELYQDGKATGKKLELNKDNDWKAEFKDLDTLEKIDSEKAYEYTVKEVGEETGKITIGKNKYQVSYDGSMEKGFKVTNKKEISKTPDKPGEPGKPSKPNIPITPRVPNKPNTPIKSKGLDKFGKSNSPKTGINGLGNVLATAFTAAIALFASRNKKED